ncbi:MAG: Fe-S cluster assembly protein SufD [Thermodesulfobacteriota bacterium]|jgi:Fe-S cluster assembly protein SufD
MVDVATALDRYLADFERFARENVAREPAWLRDLRASSIARFADLGFPTTRLEEWKYTNLAPLAKIPFTPATWVPDGRAVDSLGPITLADVAGAQLVFVNGRYAPSLSRLCPLPGGVRVESLATALQTCPHLIEPHLARYANSHEHPFVALNTAFLGDGAFVFVPAGAVLTQPLHLLFLTAPAGEPTVAHPRTLIVAGAGSQATVVESYVGLGDGVYFTNAVTEVLAGEHAVIEYTRVQLENADAFHIGTVQARQERASTVVSHTVTLGGALTRTDVNAALAGEGSECGLNGLYAVAGRQHVDNATRIDHVRPHCTSRELYKGVLAGQSRGAFSGKIVVHKTAPKTDARQTNKNLLLSDDALIDSRPQLEIFNNDVQCAHGSTIGEIDEDALFYLRARGLDREAARWLLTYAFVSEVLSRIKIDALRGRLGEQLAARVHLGGGREGVE